MRVVARRNTKAMALVLGKLLLRSVSILQGPPLGGVQAARKLAKVISINDELSFLIQKNFHHVI